ncbi:MAG: hypothetical protein HDT13_01650 [Butyrivibrio sp.]|nr:hypothetical protein [Butyrivibrio sp.]
MNSIKRKKSTLLVCLGLVMALVLTTLVPTTSMEVQAAKKVTTNYNWRKAPTVKVGTTTVTARPVKSSNYKKKNLASVGFIKFTAPKAGTYQFTISNLVKKGDAQRYTNGAVTFWTGNGSANSIWPDKYLKVKTQGGKSHTLWLCSKRYSSGKVTAATFLTSRTATVKLSKGQVVYMDFNNSYTNTCTLKIKKK